MTTNNLTPRGIFLRDFLEGRHAEGDAWVHPLYGNVIEARANSRRWGIAEAIYPIDVRGGAR